ncbi:unnamed protein product [Rhizopus stolonifer]
MSVEVFVWMALLLKRENKCNIVCPEWLTEEFLKQRQEEEETNAEFSKLPFHYMELAQLLIDTASDDIPNVSQIRGLLKNLRETRQTKARLGLDYLDDKYLGMNNLSLMEVNEIRPFFTKAFESMRRLNTNEE